MTMEYRIVDAGESAFLIQFDGLPSESLLQTIRLIQNKIALFP